MDEKTFLASRMLQRRDVTPRILQSGLTYYIFQGVFETPYNSELGKLEIYF